MSIQSSSILYDGTVSATGGTATTLKSKGGTNNELTVFLDDGSDFFDQKTVQFTVREPKVSASAPNGYTQARNKVRVMVPLALDNGNVTINTMEIHLNCDPETTDAEISTMLSLGGQLCTDSDFLEFWQKRSLA